SPREYSNSSRLCSLIKRMSCSNCSISGFASDGLVAFLAGFLDFMPVSDLNEIPRKAGQYLRAPSIHPNIGPHPDAPQSCLVTSRLDGAHVPGFQHAALAFRNSGIFVPLNPKPVPGAMHKKAVQPMSCQDLSGCRIDLAATNPRLNRRYRSCL